jgi:eukaryotic-like serine/threonine-protein kinase
MALSPGARLGAYEILAPLGAGGMGDVYRALDITLDREVAIKVLPDAFAQHPDRLARFEREARLLASLSHPNIAVVHALHHVDNVYYLQMELVRGETLADRIARSPLPLKEALQIFRQVAEALEAAHGHSMVHRDLKPANIMITPQGLVKILDFGLAKIVSTDDSRAPLTQGPTRTPAPTEAGIIIGTANYMSPEQARGDPVDRRTDIWAFGCIMHEAVAGRRAFQGRTPSDTIAAILKEEPDWTALAAAAPPRLHVLIKRCLQKDPHLRLHDIADARIEIDEMLRDPLGAQLTLPPIASHRASSVRNRALLLGAAAVLVAVSLATGVPRWVAGAGGSGPAKAMARLMITLPGGQALERGRFTPVALSPDGTHLVYVAAQDGGQTHLYVRRIDEIETRPLAATEGATTPFFSPDGRWIGFYGGGALKKMSLAGGVPLTIADTPPVWSASWAGDRIVFATTLAASGLWTVPADGGEPQPLTMPGPDDSQHGYPQILPDGAHVLFSVLRPRGWQAALLTLATSEWRLIGDGRTIGEGAQYLSTGHLVYMQAGGLVATRFEPPRGGATRSEPTRFGLDEPPIPLMERVETSRFGGAYFAIAARAGSLVYLSASPKAASRTLLRVDREGRATAVLDAHLGYEHPVFSPDGQRVAVTIASEAGSDIWIIDLKRGGTRTRFTTGNTSAFPVWSADGLRLAFQSATRGPWNLFWRPADQSAEPAPILGASVRPPSVWPSLIEGLLPGSLPTLSGANPQFPTSWAPGQAGLAFHERKTNGERDIWVTDRDGGASPFLRTASDELFPRFSPDGRWLAYVSNESGANEVYVQPFPGPGEKWIVSNEGGTDPVWARNGHELFYRQGDQMMAVSISSARAFATARPKRLFEARFDADDSGPNYDIAPDGLSFLLARSDQASVPGQLQIVLNWFTDLTARTRAVN